MAKKAKLPIKTVFVFNFKCDMLHRHIKSKSHWALFINKTKIHPQKSLKLVPFTRRFQHDVKAH